MVPQAAPPALTPVEELLDELYVREAEFQRRGWNWVEICLVLCARAQDQTAPAQFERSVVVALYLHDDIDMETYRQLIGE